MGIYINPKTESKEEWLEKNATKLQARPNPDDIREFARKQGLLLVCLVDNGFFTAAGVAYDRREAEVFLNPTDMRPTTWYLAPIEELYKVSDLGEHEGILDWIQEDDWLQEDLLDWDEQKAEDSDAD